MAKQDWLNEVVKVLRATPPPFPGEPDAAYAVLEKAVNYAYSKCFNDGEVGKDGCPVCRAYRTEVAEALATSSQTASQAATKRVDAAERAIEAVEAENGVLTDVLTAAQANLETARTDAKTAQETAAKAVQERDEALAERGSAQRQAAQADSDAKLLNEHLSSLKAQLSNVKQLVVSLSEAV